MNNDPVLRLIQKSESAPALVLKADSAKSSEVLMWALLAPKKWVPLNKKLVFHPSGPTHSILTLDHL